MKKLKSALTPICHFDKWRQDDNSEPPPGFLMRHGSVTYFDGAGKPFLPETVPLNEDGRAQADAAGHAFAAAGVRFDRVIVSGLPRTVETAARVLAVTGQAIEAEVWPELEEIRGGRLSTIPAGRAEARLHRRLRGPGAGRTALPRRRIGRRADGPRPPRDRPPARRPSWDTVLLVLHGGVNCAILSLALTGQRLFLGGLAQAPGCINALDVGED
jgi:broad specificity phosphatase PhoE